MDKITTNIIWSLRNSLNRFSVSRIYDTEFTLSKNEVTFRAPKELIGAEIQE